MCRIETQNGEMAECVRQRSEAVDEARVARAELTAALDALDELRGLAEATLHERDRLQNELDGVSAQLRDMSARVSASGISVSVAAAGGVLNTSAASSNRARALSPFALPSMPVLLSSPGSGAELGFAAGATSAPPHVAATASSPPALTSSRGVAPPGRSAPAAPAQRTPVDVAIAAAVAAVALNRSTGSAHSQASSGRGGPQARRRAPSEYMEPPEDERSHAAVVSAIDADTRVDAIALKRSGRPLQ